MSIIVALIIFSLIIFIHELGHFLVAIFNKVDVQEFGMGFPPRIWGKKIGKTLYSINWIPIGGFVRMLGQDDFVLEKDANSKDLPPGHFEAKSPWARIQILVAGVMMNFLLAFLLFWIGYTVGTKPLFQDTEAFQKSIISIEINVGEVVPDSPAKSAGIVEGDMIVGINDIQNPDTEELISVLQSNADNSVILHIKRPLVALDSNNTTSEVTDQESLKEPLEDYSKLDIPLIVGSNGRIGVGLETYYELGLADYTVLGAIKPAWVDFTKIIEVSLDGLGTLVTSLATKLSVPEDVTGPIGIVKMTSTVTNLGFLALMQFTAILSLSIGILNILPIPALDGGRLLFVFYELIFRKKPNKQTEGKIHMVGFLLLITLILVVTFNDIINIVINAMY